MSYVKAEAVAEHFDVSEKTVWRWAREGTIPCYRIGRSLRFVIEEIEASVRKEQKGESSGDLYGNRSSGGHVICKVR